METKKEIRNYCKNKLNALVRDHNHYNKVKYKDAVEDYRTAIGDLVDYAKRNGIKIGWTKTDTSRWHKEVENHEQTTHRNRKKELIQHRRKG